MNQTSDCEFINATKKNKILWLGNLKQIINFANHEEVAWSLDDLLDSCCNIGYCRGLQNIKKYL